MKIRGQAGQKVKKEESRPVACPECQNIKEVMMMFYKEKRKGDRPKIGQGAEEVKMKFYNGVPP